MGSDVNCTWKVQNNSLIFKQILWITADAENSHGNSLYLESFFTLKKWGGDTFHFRVKVTDPCTSLTLASDNPFSSGLIYDIGEVKIIYWSTQDLINEDIPQACTTTVDFYEAENDFYSVATDYSSSSDPDAQN